ASDRRPTERSELQARLLTGHAPAADTTRPLGRAYAAPPAPPATPAAVGHARRAARARRGGGGGRCCQPRPPGAPRAAPPPELATEGVRVARPLADYHRIGSAAGVLATVEVTAGRLDAAAEALEPAIRLIEGAGSAPFVPGLARAVGHLHLRAGRPERAVSWF